jgi:hypothetical protein
MADDKILNSPIGTDPETDGDHDRVRVESYTRWCTWRWIHVSRCSFHEMRLCSAKRADTFHADNMRRPSETLATTGVSEVENVVGGCHALPAMNS